MPRYEKYQKLMKKIADVKYSSAILHWDMQINPLENNIDDRSNQVATLDGIVHNLHTSKNLKKTIVKSLKEKDLTEDQIVNLKISLTDIETAQKYSDDFINRESKLYSKSEQVWSNAKKNNDFKSFEPYLQQIIDLKKEESEILGYTGHPYDAHLNKFEKGYTVEKLDRLFDSAKNFLIPFIEKIKEEHQDIDDSFLYQDFDRSKQMVFSQSLLDIFFYDKTRGRLDVSSHPFTTSFGPNDVRITTRFSNNIIDGIGSTIHEIFHGLYEQGLKSEEYGLPLGEALSLGMHESQSRFGENHIGLSYDFWKYKYESLQELFPNQLRKVELTNFVDAINKVESNKIRVESDELNYHLHIIIRYEIEKGLVDGTYNVKDLPAIWNQKYKDYLGVTIENDREGCLQDVHWSCGLFGYFPTYSIGTFFAAQIANKMEETFDINMDYDITLKWLRDNIHQHGQKFTFEQLCINSTGEALNINYFINYVKNKFI